MSRAICLCSGGLDSTVSTALAKKENSKLYGLSFSYGQIHSKELESAKKIGKYYDFEKHITINIDLSFCNSSLIGRGKIPEGREKRSKVPSTWVPARNLIFLSYAVAFAESVNANTIYIGVNAIDFSGYPDCRPQFVEQFNKVAKSSLDNECIEIKAPLLYKSKKEIVLLGKKLNVPFELTWSCYRGEEEACGRCDSCKLRLKGFKEAGLKDPINYKRW